MKQEYKNFKTDDFILDDGFREIILNPDQRDKFNELLQAYPGKKQEITLAAQIVRELQASSFHQSEKRKKELWQQIIGKQKRQVRLIWFKYAAALLLLICIGSIVFYLTYQKPVEKGFVKEESPPDDAVLILADGEKVSISNKESMIHYSSDGSEIIVNDSALVTHSASSKGINQLIVPYGKRSFVALSEGTKVWLNSGSKLVFPSVFTGNSREVVMEGEAFFDVTSISEQPFYIKTDAFKIKVYGTKFNVCAYQQENSCNIVLVEGKVGMSSNTEVYSNEVLMAPNQKASIIKGNREFKITHIEDTKIYTAWVEGYLIFDDESVSDVLKRVSRYYNISIETNLPPDINHIFGKLDLKDEVERVLDGIAFISKTNYEKQGNKYVFSISK
jgi:transmembrane sensor